MSIVATPLEMDDLDWLGGEIEEVEGERDTNKVRINQIKAGFRLGYEESQENRMQEGFNKGFARGGHAAFPLAALITLCTCFDESAITLNADQQQTLQQLRQRVDSLRDHTVAQLGLALATPAADQENSSPQLPEEEGCGKEGCCQLQGSASSCPSGACAAPSDSSLNVTQEMKQIQEALLQLMRDAIAHSSPAFEIFSENPFPVPQE